MIKNSEPPLVSVVMGCYNNETTIKEAIYSILNQTIQSLEFIIIDDCSNDNTLTVIESICDERIVLVKNEYNMGLGYNLNYGFSISRGKYIARMDANDISYSRRFEKQIDFLKKNTDVVCVGTAAKKIGNIKFFTRIKSPIIHNPSNFEEIKVRLLIGTPMMHPSVMFNATIIKKLKINYNPQFTKAQDYELFSRLMFEAKLSNVPNVLIKYRYSNQQSSVTSRETQINNSLIIYERLLSFLFNRKTLENEIYYHKLFSTKNKLTNEEFDLVSKWLSVLVNQLLSNDFFNSYYVTKCFSLRWAVICRESFSFNSRFKKFLSCPEVGKFTINNILHLIL